MSSYFYKSGVHKSPNLDNQIIKSVRQTNKIEAYSNDYTFTEAY